MNPQFRMETVRLGYTNQALLRCSGRLILGHGADGSFWTPLVAGADGVDLLLDLAAVTQIDAAGVGVIVDLCRSMHRRGGTVVAYGITASLRGGRRASGRSGRRHRYRAIAVFGLYIAGSWLLPGRKRVVPYSIQWLKRREPALFRRHLLELFELLQQKKIRPIVAQRLPLAEARHAHELLGKGGVAGKIVLVPG